MKCYVINLDRSVERMKHMESILSRHQLEFERVPAVDGRNLTSATLKNVSANNGSWGTSLTPTEIGCFLSHRRCLSLIADGIHEYAVVFEDDVEIAPDAGQLLNRIDWIPDGADLIKIETYGKKVLIGECADCDGSRYSVAKLMSAHILAAGYIISRGTARKLVEAMDLAYAPIDHFLFEPNVGPFNTLNIYQCFPAVCRQAGFESTLETERQKRRALRNRLSGAKLIKREILRLVQRSETGIKGLWINLFSKNRWGKIPF